MTKLSIITVNLNNSFGLEKTIQSIIHQSFNDYEFIIIDGGSVDNSLEIIHKYDKNLTKWVSEKDDGIYDAMNKGILHSSGEYLFFLNSGDILAKPDVLYQVFKNNFDFDIIYGDVNLHFLKDKTIIKRHPDELTMLFLFSSALCHQSVFIKRELFNSLGPYNVQYKLASDWLFILQAVILQNCSYKHLNKIISDYYVNGVSTRENLTLSDERESILKSLLPARVISDYSNWSRLLSKKPLYLKFINFLKKHLRR